MLPPKSYSCKPAHTCTDYTTIRSEVTLYRYLDKNISCFLFSTLPSSCVCPFPSTLTRVSSTCSNFIPISTYVVVPIRAHDHTAAWVGPVNCKRLWNVMTSRMHQTVWRRLDGWLITRWGGQKRRGMELSESKPSNGNSSAAKAFLSVLTLSFVFSLFKGYPHLLSSSSGLASSFMLIILWVAWCSLPREETGGSD